jgi:hypothetical protein
MIIMKADCRFPQFTPSEAWAAPYSLSLQILTPRYATATDTCNFNSGTTSLHDVSSSIFLFSVKTTTHLHAVTCATSLIFLEVPGSRITLKISRFQASDIVKIRSRIFWDVTQPRLWPTFRHNVYFLSLRV